MKQRVLVIACLLLFQVVAAQQIAKLRATDIQQILVTHTDTVLVINFWATFCKPCVEEIPYLQQIANKFKVSKVGLLLVSLDLPTYYPAKIAAFAKKRRFTAPLAWLNETDADYFCPLIDKKWSGVIPATLIVNTKTGYRAFYESQLSPTAFETAIQKALTPL